MSNFQPPIDPATRRALNEARRLISNQLPAAQLVANQFSAQYADVFKQLSQITKPKIEIPKIELPRIALTHQVLFPDMTDIMSGLRAQLEPAFEALREVQRAQFGDIFQQLDHILDAALPPNWRDARARLGDFAHLALDEGLALGWVPEAEILELLFEAADAKGRRNLIGRRWKRLTSNCREQLEGVSNRRLARHARYALEAADTLETGSAAAAQALCANLLDTVLREYFTEKERRAIVGQKTRPDIDSFTIRRAVVLGGIWGAFGEYWPAKGDPVPTKFSRHASAHAVGARQFSRRNAVIALMHVTSLLKLLETELAGT